MPPASATRAVRSGRYQLAAIDMDGTLLRSDGSVSARTRQSLRLASENGILPVLVSARPPRIVRTYCKMLAIDGLALCCNGAIVYDPANDVVVDGATFAINTTRTLVRDLRAAIPGVTLAWECGLAYGCERGFLLAHHFAGGSEELDTAAFDVSKLLVHHPRLDQAELRRRTERVVGSSGTVTISGHDIVEIAARGVDKAAGVARLAGSLGVSPSAVVAFGDMPNDAPLLSWAGLGVAVENAHRDVRAVADEVTASNDEDGVAIVLERLTRSVFEDSELRVWRGSG